MVSSRQILYLVQSLVMHQLFGATFEQQQGWIESNEPSAVYADADLYLGGLFSIHEKNPSTGLCSKLKIGSVLALEAALFSLDEINRANILGGGLKLGLLGFDTCSSEKNALMHVKAIRKDCHLYYFLIRIAITS